MEVEDYWYNTFWESGNVLWRLGERYKIMFDFGLSVDLRAYIMSESTVLYVEKQKVAIRSKSMKL